MGLRVADREDSELIVEMAMKFLNSTRYAVLMSEEQIKSVVDFFLISPNDKSIIFLYDKIGMLVGTTSPLLFSGPPIATEIAWWVNPEDRGTNVGKELLDAFENWAKYMGCKAVTMSCLDDRVGKFYEKNGYVLSERAYIKDL